MFRRKEMRFSLKATLCWVTNTIFWFSTRCSRAKKYFQEKLGEKKNSFGRAWIKSKIFFLLTRDTTARKQDRARLPDDNAGDIFGILKENKTKKKVFWELVLKTLAPWMNLSFGSARRRTCSFHGIFFFYSGWRKHLINARTYFFKRLVWRILDLFILATRLLQARGTKWIKWEFGRRQTWNKTLLLLSLFFSLQIFIFEDFLRKKQGYVSLLPAFRNRSKQE